VPKPAEKVSNLEDTKFVEKIEKPAQPKVVTEIVEDDLDKTMTYTPIKKS